MIKTNPSVKFEGNATPTERRRVKVGQDLLMEYVSDNEVDGMLAANVVHPWVMVQKGEKWRACFGAHEGTNRVASSAPFALPTVRDVTGIVKKTSRFAKYDLRDGFWLVPVAEKSRQHLLLRQTATGRLMRCAKLPFGYKDSPRQFAKVTEEIAAELRRRLAGRGVWVFVYVDDFLIVGGDEDTTLMAMLEFERLLDVLGVQ